MIVFGKLICLVLLQVPKCFVSVQMFWASPKIWLHLVTLQKLLCHHKNQFYWMQIIFWSGTKCLWLAQYVNNVLVRHNKFGPAQNIWGPVKGQDISDGLYGRKLFPVENVTSVSVFSSLPSVKNVVTIFS